MPNEGPTRYWPLRVKAAYYWLLGQHTQDEIGEKVGRSASTLRRWMRDDTWEQAKAEAEDRWLQEVMREARHTVLSAIATERDQEGTVERWGDHELAFEIIQRRDDRVRPREERVSIDADVNVDQDDARERLARRLASASADGETPERLVRADGNGSGGT